jgi:hypothetical protein
MQIDAKHPDYAAHVDKWQRIRDVTAGTDEVKSRSTNYLPKPKGHDDEDYQGYLKRAEFYPATQRTVDGLTGAIFRKEPQVTVPDGTEELLEAMTARGLDFTTFSKQVVREVLSLGRYGVLVDVRDGDDKAFAAGYDAESIINWRVEFIDRQPVLTLMVLRENVMVPSATDPFITETKERYRVLHMGILEETDKSVYVQEIYEKQKDKAGKDSFVLLQQIIPVRRGEPLDKIPFTVFGPTDLSAEIQKSPILDLVDTNLSHYRTSAELEEGAYFTGLPMYVISGRGLGEEDPVEFQVGSRAALRLDEGGSAQVLTVSGEGMGLLSRLMDSKESRMAVLGARILEDQKAGVEAAATVAMRHRGENSLLASLSDTVARGLTDVLETMIWWSGADTPDVTTELNKDFTGAQLSGAELVQLTAAFQSGSIGPEVFFKALKDGERVPDGWTIEDWLADIDEGATAFERGLSNEGAEVIEFEGAS